MGLQRRSEGVADFVVADNPLFLVAENCILLLVAHGDNLHTLLQIMLVDLVPIFPQRHQASLINDVSQHSAGSTGGKIRHLVKIQVILMGHTLQVVLQNLDAAFYIRQLHRNFAIKPTRTTEGGVQ